MAGLPPDMQHRLMAAWHEPVPEGVGQLNENSCVRRDVYRDGVVLCIGLGEWRRLVGKLARIFDDYCDWSCMFVRPVLSHRVVYPE